jgi:hypothetical protein
MRQVVSCAALAAYQQATACTAGCPPRLLALFCADNSIQVAEIGLPAAVPQISIPKTPASDALGWSYAQAGFDQAEKTSRP